MRHKLDLIFAALSDATRRDMLARLLAGDLNIGALAEQYPISFQAASKHIARLAEAGLVRIEARGRTRLVRIEVDGLCLPQLWLESLAETDAIWELLEARIMKHEKRVAERG